MTSPVLVHVQGEVYTTLFRVGGSLRISDEDVTEGVFLINLPEMIVNSYEIRGFGGYASYGECEDAIDRICRCVGEKAAPAEWYVAFYDAPYKFWNRRDVVFYSSRL